MFVCMSIQQMLTSTSQYQYAYEHIKSMFPRVTQPKILDWIHRTPFLHRNSTLFQMVNLFCDFKQCLMLILPNSSILTLTLMESRQMVHFHSKWRQILVKKVYSVNQGCNIFAWAKRGKQS